MIISKEPYLLSALIKHYVIPTPFAEPKKGIELTPSEKLYRVAITVGRIAAYVLYAIAFFFDILLLPIVNGIIRSVLLAKEAKDNWKKYTQKVDSATTTPQDQFNKDHSRDQSAKILHRSPAKGKPSQQIKGKETEADVFLQYISSHLTDPKEQKYFIDALTQNAFAPIIPLLQYKSSPQKPTELIEVGFKNPQDKEEIPDDFDLKGFDPEDQVFLQSSGKEKEWEAFLLPHKRKIILRSKYTRIAKDESQPTATRTEDLKTYIFVKTIFDFDEKTIKHYTQYVPRKSLLKNFYTAFLSNTPLEKNSDLEEYKTNWENDFGRNSFEIIDRSTDPETILEYTNLSPKNDRPEKLKAFTKMINDKFLNPKKRAQFYKLTYQRVVADICKRIAEMFSSVIGHNASPIFFAGFTNPEDSSDKLPYIPTNDLPGFSSEDQKFLTSSSTTLKYQVHFTPQDTTIVIRTKSTLVNNNASDPNSDPDPCNRPPDDKTWVFVKTRISLEKETAHIFSRFIPKDSMQKAPQIPTT